MCLVHQFLEETMTALLIVIPLVALLLHILKVKLKMVVGQRDPKIILMQQVHTH